MKFFPLSLNISSGVPFAGMNFNSVIIKESLLKVRYFPVNSKQLKKLEEASISLFCPTAMLHQALNKVVDCNEPEGKPTLLGPDCWQRGRN